MNLYAVGKLIGCFGIKGFIKIHLLTDSPERFDSLRNVFVGASADGSRSYEVDAIEIRNKGPLIKFKAVDDRTAAESLIGGFVFVDEEHVMPPEPGSYFVHELLGCDVVSLEGEMLGKVKEVYRLPGHDLWEVVQGSTSVMLPAVKEFVKSVDVKKRKVTVEPIEGLFERGESGE